MNSTSFRSRGATPRPTRTVAATLAILAASLGITACSSSGAGAKASGTDATPPSTSSVVSAGSSAETPSAGGSVTASVTGSSCETTAQNRLKPISGSYVHPAPIGNFDIKGAKNKNIWIIEVVNASGVVGLANGVSEAAQAAGYTTHKYLANGTLPSWTTGIQEAIAQNAGGIVLDAIPIEAVKGVVKPAAAKHIPVVEYGADEPDGSRGGVSYANIAPNNHQIGAYAADGAILETKCAGQFLILTYAFQPVQQDLANAAAAEVKSVCPACVAHIVNLNIADAATVQTAAVQTGLTRYPKTNFIIGSNDLLASTVTQVVKQHNLKMSSVNCDDSALPLIGPDKTQIFDICFPPPNYQGWATFDLVARGMSGQPSPTPAQTTFLPFFLKPDASYDPKNPFPAFGDYKSSYKQAWGIG